VRDLVRKSPKFFGAALLAGLGLRLLFFFAFPQVTDDSRIYADIARNWLRHGIYGISAPGSILPTYIRLPGYPGFLAAVFAIFGDNNFRVVLLCEIVLDLGTCLLIADLARRIAGPHAAKAAFLLAALCPFLANYAAAVLTETLEIFFTALALDLAVTGLNNLSERKPGAWIGCGLAIAGCIYMRPDGGLLLPAMGMYLLLLAIRSTLFANKYSAGNSSTGNTGRLMWAGVILAIFSLGPLAPWIVRNLRTMHTFQPLTPRYANEPGEFVPAGFNRWVKTWIVDYASVEEIYWQEPGANIDMNRLPSRAFDSLEQKVYTQQILDKYNGTTEIDPDLDREFESLADQRIRGHRLRYYLRLPALRIADMWLRPRTELLPADSRWWEFNEDMKWMIVSVGFGALNLLYVLLAGAAVWRIRPIRWLGMLLLFLIVRSLFLGTLENPEPRYTLECYPVVIALAGTALERYFDSMRKCFIDRRP
jgi:dolichyl-phosphate-mannose-protein mannosyltransferase